MTAKNKNYNLVPESVQQYIILIRVHKVMLSTYLAVLYGVKPKVLMQAVHRNSTRFPNDFMFQLTLQELTILRSQIVTANWAMMRTAPYAFTEQGVAMLSSVLHSEQAIQMNIAIMRTFVKLRELISSHKELAQQLAKLENKISQHDEEIQTIFNVIKELMTIPEKPKHKIGFHSN